MGEWRMALNVARGRCWLVVGEARAEEMEPALESGDLSVAILVSILSCESSMDGETDTGEGDVAIAALGCRSRLGDPQGRVAAWWVWLAW